MFQLQNKNNNELVIDILENIIDLIQNLLKNVAYPALIINFLY